MTGVFLDSSIFVSHCMVGDETLISLLRKYRLCTSPNVIEESYYKSLYLKTEDISGKSGKYQLKERYLKSKDDYRPVFNYYNVFIKRLIEYEALTVLPLSSEIILESFEISWNYGLLPNDALIAATCKHYGIKKIATFDEDFERVDFLEVIEL